MQTEETKDNGTQDGCADFGCCNPENFKSLFGMMGKSCPGRGDSTDLSAMMGGKMKSMMEMCCGPKTIATKEDPEFQKEQAGGTESTEKEGMIVK
jgi:hypothetical protein